MSHQQSPCGDSIVGVGDGGKEVEGCVDQLMGLGECETVCSSSAFEQWDSYWEDLTRYLWFIHVLQLFFLFLGHVKQQQQVTDTQNFDLLNSVKLVWFVNE